MLFNFGSLLFVVLITSYSIIYGKQRSAKMSEASGMGIAVTLALLSGTAFGFVSGQTFQDYPIAVVIGSMLIAAAAGYINGKWFGLAPSLNGLLAGIFGSLIGSYFGLVLFASQKALLIADILFVICIVLVQRFMDAQAKDKRKSKKSSSKHPNQKKVKYSGMVILTMLVVVSAGFILMQKDRIGIGELGQPQTQTAAYDEENDIQEVTIHVSASGISPKTIQFQPESMVKANFNVKPNVNHPVKLHSNELGIDAELREGNNRVIMNKPQPGTYEITLEPGGFTCTFVIEDTTN
jgi:hypothetical protein